MRLLLRLLLLLVLASYLLNNHRLFPGENPWPLYSLGGRELLNRVPGIAKDRSLIECDSGARVRQINGPNVVQGHSMQKLMNTQWQAFELSSRNLWHGGHSLPESLGLSLF